MSLKAKLEAVIYAAEEPVTLAQFASLFAEEALAWKAAQEAVLQAGTEAETDAEPADSSRELIDLLEVAEGDSAVELTIAETTLAEGGEAAAEADADVAPSSAVDDVATEAATPAIDAEVEAKRVARVREKAVREILRGILDELIADYANDARGIEIREIAGGFRMGTKPEIHDAVRAFAKSLKPPMKLSMPALETLAVVAYKQPVTAPEVGEIRGVDSGGVLGSLMSRKLIATAGRKQVIGRPMLYKTTKEFLLRFGLKDLNELPSMEEFEKMAVLELSEGDEAENQTGDLFAAAESVEAKENEPGVPEHTSDEEQTVVTTPTAEPSEEAAAAQAPVERQDAEEIEAAQ